jgi:16S rRNA (uracil1498-N3)-methyltransferase
MPHRFFVPPAWLTPPFITLRDDVAHQICAVLRLKPGDTIITLDNSGMEWQVKLTRCGREVVEGQLISQQPAQGEPSLHLTLYQGTLKGQKFEWVLQKGTELGVSCFTPTICRRSVVSEVEALAKKRDRWQHIIREAAEQSRRGRLPHLEAALTLAEAVQQAQSVPLIVMPWEEAAGPSLKTILTGNRVKAAAIFIGPEGGFTNDEAALMRQAGGQVVKLGPRILRAETAGLAVCAALLYEWDEWK